MNLTTNRQKPIYVDYMKTLVIVNPGLKSSVTQCACWCETRTLKGLVPSFQKSL